MREFIHCYINGKRHELRGREAFMTVGEYLRYEKGLTGTKIVCSEGDCGACTVLVSRMVGGEMTPYRSVNSCISYMYLLDRCHLITVEGVGKINHMHQVQEKMVECHGSQCGYCTPGFICAMAGMAEDLKIKDQKITEQKVKNYLTGNLCRCTGYEPIVKAGEEVDLNKVELLGEVYQDKDILADFQSTMDQTVKVNHEDKEVFLPSSFKEVVAYKADNEYCNITSGATDLGVLQNKGRLEVQKILSLNNLSEAYKVYETDETLEIGAKVSLTDVEEASKKSFPEFSRMLRIFASPQIKNKGTLVGNVINASPISDTVPFLRAADAKLVLVSASGVRIPNINDFILGGYKELDLKPSEFVFKISIPKTESQFKLYKVSVRKDLDISAVTFASRYKIEKGIIKEMNFVFGGVGPCVLKIDQLEKMVVGKKFTQQLFKDVAAQIENIISPLSDLRGSKEFRYIVCKNLILKFYDEVYREMGISPVEASV